MYNKEKIYLSQAQVECSLPKVASTNPSTSFHKDKEERTSLANMGQKEETSMTDSFLAYLDSWGKEAQNFDVSDALTSAVDRVKAFPADSVAFCVGVTELARLASEEVAEGSKEIGEVIQEKGVVAGVKVLVKKGGNFFILTLEPMYNKAQEAVATASKYILGDDRHEALSSLIDKYVTPIGQYLVDKISKFFQDKSESAKERQNEYKGISTISSVDLSAAQSSEKSNNKQDFLSELVNRASGFLNNSEGFFAHNILDKEGNGASALTPEILVEADIRTRPVYDPLPPAWVVAERHKAQDEMNEYKRAYGENAPVDLQNGEITNLAKINLLTKSKIS